MNELKSPAYWLGHGITLIATVIGVYFAAIEGFRVAVDLESLTTDRDTYHTGEALRQELAFNVSQLERQLQALEGEKAVYDHHIQAIKLNTFLFDTAKNMEATLALDPSLLMQISVFYFNVQTILADFKTPGGPMPKQVVKELTHQLAQMSQQQTQQRLADYCQAMAASLKARGLEAHP